MKNRTILLAILILFVSFTYSSTEELTAEFYLEPYRRFGSVELEVLYIGE